MSVKNASPFDDASGQELLSWLATVGGPSRVIQKAIPTGSTIDDALVIQPGITWIPDPGSSAGAGFKLSKGALPGQIWVVIPYWQAVTTKIYPPSGTISWYDDTGSYPPGTPIEIGTTFIAVLFPLGEYSYGYAIMKLYPLT